MKTGKVCLTVSGVCKLVLYDSKKRAAKIIEISYDGELISFKDYKLKVETETTQEEILINYTGEALCV